jgi:hypothetical protein
VALALRTLAGLARAGEWLDDLAAFGGGALDAYLLKWNALAFLLKNVAVPILDKLVIKLPRGLVLESEGMLGFIIMTLVGGK